MKTRNSKTKASALITAAFIVLTAALVFTACPNSAGGGSGSGSTVNITVNRRWAHKPAGGAGCGTLRGQVAGSAVNG